jgi:hypothetical protein
MCRKQFCLFWLPRAMDFKVSCSQIPRRAFAGIRTHDPLVESDVLTIRLRHSTPGLNLGRFSPWYHLNFLSQGVFLTLIQYGCFILSATVLQYCVRFQGNKKVCIAGSVVNYQRKRLQGSYNERQKLKLLPWKDRVAKMKSYDLEDISACTTWLEVSSGISENILTNCCEQNHSSSSICVSVYHGIPRPSTIVGTMLCLDPIPTGHIRG